VIAVYSSQPTAPLSLLARTRTLNADAFMDLERTRAAIRLPAMRGSVFLIPRETAPCIFAATRIPLKKLQARLSYGGLSWDDYEYVKAAFLEHANIPRSTDELNELIPIDGKLMVAIRVLAYEGLALRVGESLRGDSFKYISTTGWMDEPLAEHEPLASLQWLASAYLRAFGPVRPDDFAWWAGVTKTRARTAFGALASVDIGDGLLLLEDDVSDFHRCEPPSGDEIALLPKWDPYTMGYPAESRARFVDDADQPRAYPKIRATSGDGAPLLLRGGKAVAVWGHRFNGNRMTVTVAPFDTGDRLDWLEEHYFADIGSVLGASEIELIRDLD
jgi:hypothetical protein